MKKHTKGIKLKRRAALKKTAQSFGITFIPSYLATGLELREILNLQAREST